MPATRRNGAEAPVYSDDRLALTLIDRYGIDLRYVDAWKQWLLWDGTRWRADTTLAIFDMARRLCRAVLESNPMLGAAGVNALTDAATFAAVERVARSDRRVAATADLWDVDTWLFNTPAGTVDLRTGTMREHRRQDCITKSPYPANAGIATAG